MKLFVRILLIVGIVSVLVPSQATGSDTSAPKLTEADKVSLPDVLEVVLQYNPSIKLSRKDVVSRKGELQSARGEFDYTLSTNLSNSILHNPLPGVEDPPSYTTSYSINLMKTFRTGTKLGPLAEVTRSKDHNLIGDPVEPQPEYTGKIGFKVVQPLLAGAGKEAVTAREDAASYRLKASKDRLYNTISSELKTVVKSFWRYLAACERLNVREKSVERTKSQLEQVRELIAHNEKPRAELDQVQAQLADKKSARIRAEQSYVEARHQLGLAMGIPSSRINQLPEPSGDFPTVETYDTQLAEKLNSYIRTAMENRRDLQANEHRVKASRRLLAEAKNAEWQNLDLSFELNYKGIEEGEDEKSLYYSSPTKNRTDLNIKSSVSFKWPLRNDRAEGTTKQRRSSYRQQLIKLRNLKRTIRSQLRVALSNVQSQYNSLRETRQSVSSHEKALENERKKYRIGASTIVDVISTEERLTSAHLNLIQAKQQYAQALAELRFQAGLFLQNGGVVDPAQLSKFPRPKTSS